MNFEPISDRYKFDPNDLSMDIPDYLRRRIKNWLYKIFQRKQLIHDAGMYIRERPGIPIPGGRIFLADDLLEPLETHLREVFPEECKEWNRFINHVFDDTDRTLIVMQWCLNYCAQQQEANQLESILSRGGSGYTVLEVKQENARYTDGGYDLIKRTPEVVEKMARPALSQNSQLLEAWVSCYGIKTNYDNVVLRCNDVLEGMLKNRYFPADQKPTFGKLLGNFESGFPLQFKGSDILENPNVLLDLIRKFPQFRGIHTEAGTGKKPNKGQAEYILLTTIYIWSLHQVSGNEGDKP